MRIPIVSLLVPLKGCTNAGAANPLPLKQSAYPGCVGAVEDKCPDPVFEHVGDKVWIDNISSYGFFYECEKFPGSCDTINGFEYHQITTEPAGNPCGDRV